MRQTKSETKENQRDKNGKMSLLFNKAGKGCVLDKSRKAVIEVVKKSYKGSFITEGYFLFSFLFLFLFFIYLFFFFFDNLKAFHEIFSCKVYFVLFQSLIDLT